MLPSSVTAIFIQEGKYLQRNLPDNALSSREKAHPQRIRLSKTRTKLYPMFKSTWKSTTWIESPRKTEAPARMPGKIFPGIFRKFHFHFKFFFSKPNVSAGGVDKKTLSLILRRFQ